MKATQPYTHIWVLFTYLLLFPYSYSQENQNTVDVSKISKLFSGSSPISVRLEYSSKDIKQKTKDSKYAETTIHYKTIDSIWFTIPAKIRARGNFRRERCGVLPIKVKIQTFNQDVIDSLGSKKLKLVQPCFLNKKSNDNLLKEYIAYKLYEIITPYHFKTRLLQIDFSETKKPKKLKRNRFPGFLIEPIEDVAKRLDGKVVSAKLSYSILDDKASVRLALFQFLIGNTDFSTIYQHNCKLLYHNKKYIPIPYDFDLSGLVNPDYAVVSNIAGESLEINRVTQRLYRGIKTDEKTVQSVRKEFLGKKKQILEAIMASEEDFDNPREYKRVVKFINDFFKIIGNHKKFQDQIIGKARS